MFPMPDFDVNTSEMSTTTILVTVTVTLISFGWGLPTLISWRIDHPDETLWEVIKRQYIYMRSLRFW